jgi:hypothetical protein
VFFPLFSDYTIGVNHVVLSVFSTYSHFPLTYSKREPTHKEPWSKWKTGKESQIHGLLEASGLVLPPENGGSDTANEGLGRGIFNSIASASSWTASVSAGNISRHMSLCAGAGVGDLSSLTLGPAPQISSGSSPVTSPLQHQNSPSRIHYGVRYPPSDPSGTP